MPKEAKPSALDALIAIGMPQEAAQILELPIFCICDDYKSFFNQLRLAPSKYCKTGAVHSPRKGRERVSFAYDTVLGFGIKLASNIAQRFADFLVHIFKRIVAPAVELAASKFCKENKLFAEWWQQRLALGQAQAVRVTMLMYCDDPIILCCGTDLTHEALKAWTYMTTKGSTMMAIPEKRSLGLSIKGYESVSLSRWE